MIVGRFAAMGTRVEAYGTGHEPLDRVEAWFEEVEECCSRFRPSSELSRANRSGGRVALSPLLNAAVQEAARMRRLTDGLVDAGLGATLAAWGYDRTFEDVPGRDRAPDPAAAPEWSVAGGVLSLGAGVSLDLGGIAKGWACDRAVEDGLASMVSAGGDLRSSDPATVVRIEGSGGDTVAEVPVGVGGLATSSTARRRWRVGGEMVSHLIDPRTGRPVRSPIVSATVTAATALEAEAGAKAILLMGEDGLVWAERRDWIRSALVEWHDGAIYGTKEVAA